MSRRRDAIGKRALHACVVFIACACAPALARQCDETNVTSFRRWADLRAFLNPKMRGAPCVVRVNVRGDVRGCSNDRVERAPLMRVDPLGDVDFTALTRAPRVLLATPAAWQKVLERAYVKDDEMAREIRANVKGVLVESVHPTGEADKALLKGFSLGPAARANTTGGRTGGIDAVKMDFRGTPMMLLDTSSTHAARIRAMANARAMQENKGEKHMWRAEVDMRMTSLGKQPTIAPPSSESCLKANTCLPVGGYSVLATMPPLNRDVASTKSIVLVVARMDADGVFRDATPATNARMSGLIALMAVAKSLQKSFSSLTEDDFAHHVAFVALSGEDFGNVGSQRLARELAADAAESLLPELAGRKLRAVIELGPMGMSNSFEAGKMPALFVHGPHIDEVSKKISQYADTYEFDVTFKKGMAKILDSSEPSFESVRGLAYDAVYISEDRDQTSDPLSGTHLDVGVSRSIDVDRMGDAVRSIARLIGTYVFRNTNSSYATHDGDIVANTFDDAAGRATVIELSKCLADQRYGLDKCSSGLRLINEKTVSRLGEYIASDGYVDPTHEPSRYPDVLVGIPRSVQAHNDKKTLARFVWSYLAEATSMSSTTSKMCESDGSCRGQDEVCVGKNTANAGTCHKSSPRYILALSSRLGYDHRDGSWIVKEPKDDDERIAPLWTESNWAPGVGFTMIAPAGEGNYFSQNMIAIYAVGALAFVAILHACIGRKKTTARRGTDAEREGLLQ